MCQPCQAGAHDVPHRLIHGVGQRLRELADHEAGVANDLAAVRFQVAVDEPERGRLAGAVAADQADTLTGIDRELGLDENFLVTEIQ